MSNNKITRSVDDLAAEALATLERRVMDRDSESTGRCMDALRELSELVALVGTLTQELDELRDTLARVRPDIDPKTGYGHTEAI